LLPDLLWTINIAPDYDVCSNALVYKRRRRNIACPASIHVPESDSIYTTIIATIYARRAIAGRAALPKYLFFEDRIDTYSTEHHYKNNKEYHCIPKSSHLFHLLSSNNFIQPSKKVFKTLTSSNPMPFILKTFHSGFSTQTNGPPAKPIISEIEKKSSSIR